MPVGFLNFKSALRAGVEIFHSLKSVLQDSGLSTSIGDEGGFAPEIDDVEDAINMICRAIEKAKYKIRSDIFFAIDAALTNFLK